MNLQQLAFCWMVLLAVTNVVSSMAIDPQELSDPHSLMKRSSYQACGSNLDDLMSFACDGNFNTRFEDKRSTAAVMEHGILTLPGAGQVRDKRHIVAECCWQSCSWDTLRLYCASR